MQRINSPFDQFSDQSIVLIRKVKVLLDTWSTFGDLIERLSINFKELDDDLSKQIIKYVNDMPDSLKLLSFDHFNGNILTELTSTFPKVFGLVLSNTNSDSTSNVTIGESRKLNELFPNLGELFIDFKRVSDWELIDGTFPNLKVIIAQIPKSRNTGEIDDSHVISFLKNNRKIEKISIQHASLNILNEASKSLPNLWSLNLESLGKDYLKYKGDVIHFSNVRDLTIDVKFHEIIVPEKIVFDQLIKLKLNVRSKFTDKWMKFIENQVNSELKSLKLFNPHLKKEQLVAISKNLPKMETVDIQCQTVFEAQDVIDFVEMNKHAHEINMEFEMNITEIGLMDALKVNWAGYLVPEKETADLIYHIKMHLR